MKKLVSLIFVMIICVASIVPAFAGVRCHLPGCDGIRGNLCDQYTYNRKPDVLIGQEDGYDYNEGGVPCVYYKYLVEYDVHAVCNRNPSHTADYHVKKIVFKVAWHK